MENSPKIRKGGKILDDLLDNRQGDEGASGLEGLNEFVFRGERSSGKTAPVEQKNKDPHKNEIKKTPKKKTTFMISENVSVQLNEAKAKIKIMVPEPLRSKVSMSKIVNYAVKAILKELNSAGEDSEIIKKIMKDEAKRR